MPFLPFLFRVHEVLKPVMQSYILLHSTAVLYFIGILLSAHFLLTQTPSRIMKYGKMIKMCFRTKYADEKKDRK